MTCFEPETKGLLVEGTQFHQFMFENSKRDRPKVNCTMIAPHVQLLGTDAAVVSYTRLVQCTTSTNTTTTERWCETRVLHRVADTWKLAHCHRSQWWRAPRTSTACHLEISYSWRTLVASFSLFGIKYDNLTNWLHFLIAVEKAIIGPIYNNILQLCLPA